MRATFTAEARPRSEVVAGCLDAREHLEQVSGDRFFLEAGFTSPELPALRPHYCYVIAGFHGGKIVAGHITSSAARPRTTLSGLLSSSRQPYLGLLIESRTFRRLYAHAAAGKLVKE